MNPDRADLIGTAHVFDRPAQVTLSSGAVVDLHGVPLKAVFGITAQRERLRSAIQKYASFAAALESGERVWEGKARLTFHQKAWIEELERTCVLIVTEALTARRRGILSWYSRWRAKRRASELMFSATVADWKAILEAFEAHHAISQITEALFPEFIEKGDETQKKSPTAPTSGQASSSPSSKPSTPTSKAPTESSPASPGPESASSSASTDTSADGNST